MNLLTSTPSVTRILEPFKIAEEPHILNSIEHTDCVARILKVFETFEEPHILKSIECSQDHIFL
jgi:hypothetical protein